MECPKSIIDCWLQFPGPILWGILLCYVIGMDIRFRPRMGQIRTKWDKSVTFKEKCSVQFGSVSQNVMNLLIWKKSPDLFLLRPSWPTKRQNLVTQRRNELLQNKKVAITSCYRRHDLGHMNTILRRKVNWIDPKLDKTGTTARMYWSLIWKSPRFVPFGSNLTQFLPKSDIPVCDQYSFFLTSLNRLAQNWTQFKQFVIFKIIYYWLANCG